MSERLANETQRLELIYFLVTEIIAARLVEKSRQDSQVPRESDAAKDLKSLMISLKFPRPPDDVSPKDLFQKVR